MESTSESVKEAIILRLFTFIALAMVAHLGLGHVMAHSQESAFSHHLFVAAGEAPYLHASDMSETSLFPQVGYGLQWVAKPWLSPAFEFALGRYNHAYTSEAMLAVQVGYAWGKPRPILRPHAYVGVLGLTVRDRDFVYTEINGLVNERLSQKRLWLITSEFGARIECFEILTFGLAARTISYPMWRFTLGYRWGSLQHFLKSALHNES